MKNIINKILVLSLICISASSCKDWTKPEPKQLQHVGGYATMSNSKSKEYFSKLREYKDQAKNYGRPVAFGWFSNWSPYGVLRKGYLSSVPDSMDIISMWSGAPAKADMSKGQLEDKEFVQKVKVW